MDAAQTPSSAAPARKRWWLWSLLGLAVFCIVAVIAGVGVAGFHLSSPAPETVGPPPADLSASNVVIKSASGATLQAWFVAGRPGGGAVVLLHGIRGNRLHMVPRARQLIAEGFSVLLLDFQASGESDGSRITFGWLEGMDAESAVAWLRAKLSAEKVGVIGSSLGGAAALLAPRPLAVDALVLESVYSEIGTAISNRIGIAVGQPLGTFVARPTAWLFQLILPPFLGIRPADLRPIDRIRHVVAPVMIASGTDDQHTTLAETQAMFDRAPMPKVLWRVEGFWHGDLESFAPDEYRRRVLGFLAERLRQSR
jgi:fermentation-respiration switch protein FrsA (DUF1100 family)